MRGAEGDGERLRRISAPADAVEGGIQKLLTILGSDGSKRSGAAGGATNTVALVAALGDQVTEEAVQAATALAGAFERDIRVCIAAVVACKGDAQDAAQMLMITPRDADILQRPPPAGSRSRSGDGGSSMLETDRAASQLRGTPLISPEARIGATAIDVYDSRDAVEEAPDFTKGRESASDSIVKREDGDVSLRALRRQASSDAADA